MSCVSGLALGGALGEAPSQRCGRRSGAAGAGARTEARLFVRFVLSIRVGKERRAEGCDGREPPLPQAYWNRVLDSTHARAVGVSLGLLPEGEFVNGPLLIARRSRWLNGAWPPAVPAWIAAHASWTATHTDKGKNLHAIGAWHLNQSYMNVHTVNTTPTCSSGSPP